MLWRMGAVPTEGPADASHRNQRHQPEPSTANYWRQRDAARAAKPPPPPWPAVDPGLLEEGRPKLPAFPLQVFPGPVAGVGEGRRALGGLVGGLHRAGAAGVRRRPVRPGRVGAHHRGLERAGDPVAGAGRRPVFAARRRRSNGCADRSARSSACWRARAGRRSSSPMPRCRRWRRPWPSGGRACCCGATSRPPGWPGWGARAGATRASAGPFSTPGARSACRGAAATSPPSASWARSIRSGWTRRWREPATAWPRASSMSGPAPRPTARCAP